MNLAVPLAVASLLLALTSSYATLAYSAALRIPEMGNRATKTGSIRGSDNEELAEKTRSRRGLTFTTDCF